jgi:hypothetical protein
MNYIPVISRVFWRRDYLAKNHTGKDILVHRQKPDNVYPVYMWLSSTQKHLSVEDHHSLGVKTSRHEPECFTRVHDEHKGIVFQMRICDWVNNPAIDEWVNTAAGRRDRRESVQRRSVTRCALLTFQEHHFNKLSFDISYMWPGQTVRSTT